MTELEERVREAFRDRAGSITASRLREENPPSAGGPTRTADAPRTLVVRRWLLPSGVAAAIAAVVLATAVLGPGWGSGGTPSPADRPTLTQRTPTSPARNTNPPSHRGNGVRLPHAPLPVLAPRGSDLTEHGRRFDVGRLTGWNGRAGTQMVLYLKRLRVAGIPDSRIAEHGMPITPRTDMPYVGIGRARYAIPVATGATFVYNACTFGSSPDDIVLRHLRMSAAEFVNHVGYVSGVEATLDRNGNATEIRTDGGC